MGFIDNKINKIATNKNHPVGENRLAIWLGRAGQGKSGHDTTQGNIDDKLEQDC